MQINFGRLLTKSGIVLFIGLIVGVGACRSTQSPETLALLRAAREGHADAVKELVKTPGIDVNAVDESGNTALIEAARFGHDEVARALLAAGASTNVRDKNGKTPLMLAIAGGHEEVVIALRQSGANE
jgi:uncharacterized protein